MLSCRRGVLLAKAAGFKKIPEDIQIKQEIDAKNSPKAIEKTIKKQSQKWCGKTSENIIQSTPSCQILVPILEPVAWYFPGVARFFCDLFFGTSGGEPPWTPVDAYSPKPYLTIFKIYSERFETRNTKHCISKIQKA